MLIWFIYLIVNGSIDVMAELPSVEKDTIVSVVFDGQSR